MQAVETPSLASKSTADATAAAASETGCRRLDSRHLFAADNELLIDHEGTSYRLRITRQGKLILTK